jgi:hypothetical protein
VGVDRPADHSAGVGIQHDRAVDLALAGGVLGDIGHPQLVRSGAGELAVDQVGGDLVRLGVAPFGSAGHSGEPGAAHQHRHRAVADHDPAAKPQLSVHPASTIGSTDRLVDLDD